MSQLKICCCSNEDWSTKEDFLLHLQKHKDNWNCLLIDIHPAIEQSLSQLCDSYMTQSEAVSVHFSALQATLQKLLLRFDPSQQHFHWINDMMVELEWIIEDEVHDTKPYVYDQMMGIGSLCSSYVACIALPDTQWVDARDHIIMTDDYGQACVKSVRNIERIYANLPVVTQQRLGATNENNSALMAKGHQSVWEKLK